MTEELAECLPPLYATEGGALALDLASPEGEGYLDLWCSLTINLSGGPFSRESIPVLLMRPNMPLRMLGRRFRNFKTIRFPKLSGNKLSVRFFIKCKKAPP